MFYVYEWYIKNTNEIIYVGKGSKKRYLSKQHNNMFKEFVKRFECESRIVKEFEKEEDAYFYEYTHIEELKKINQCVCNIQKGGFGGGNSYYSNCNRWTDKEREKYSKNNAMKSEQQRKRMSENNPMRIKEYALKNAKLHSKPIIVDGIEYCSILEASKKLCVSTASIDFWLKKGHTRKHKEVRYK